jgi:transcriptional regulator NrdR family protein
MECPNCRSNDLRVIATNSTPDDHILRSRTCYDCKLKIYTIEVCLQPDHVRWVSREVGKAGSKLKLVTNLNDATKQWKKSS